MQTVAKIIVIATLLAANLVLATEYPDCTKDCGCSSWVNQNVRWGCENEQYHTSNAAGFSARIPA